MTTTSSLESGFGFPARTPVSRRFQVRVRAALAAMLLVAATSRGDDTNTLEIIRQLQRRIEQLEQKARQTAEEADRIKDEFMSTLRVDLYPEEVYTFTPKGRVIVLPRDATPVDFAYTIHTEVGHTCVGARVNGRICCEGTMTFALGHKGEALEARG